MVKYVKEAQLRNRTECQPVTVRKPPTGGFASEAGFLIASAGQAWAVYDDVCDHNGGRLRLDRGGGTATCPVHGWRLHLLTGEYENGCPKRRLPHSETPDSLIVERRVETFPEIERTGLTEAPIDFAFNAHASVSARIGDFSLVTDPWLEGPCFATGWWHLHPPAPDSIERMVRSDVIYVSHIHPDHLHLPTLRHVPKSKLFLVPRFASGSAERVLRENGFYNIIIADFMQETRFISASGVECKAIIIKSGDGRDDSSLILATRNTAVLFAVDTNMPNRWVLPRVDVLFAPFAGGASGYPSRIDNLTDREKLEIAERNRANQLALHLTRLIRATSPAFWVPYAGYFTVAGRDRDVDEVNLKNGRKQALEYVALRYPKIVGIDPIVTGRFRIQGAELMLSEASGGDPNASMYVPSEIAAFAEGAPEMNVEILAGLGREFAQSGFADDLTVAIVPCTDDFEPVLDFFLAIDFARQPPKYTIVRRLSSTPEGIAGQIREPNRNNIEVLRVRANSLRGALKHGLPLEDLSIGFQVRMYREPNVYNFRFWDYFTNVRNLRLEKPAPVHFGVVADPETQA